MAHRLSLIELKEQINRIESYLISHPSYGDPEHWPDPSSKDYWPVRWIMEYLTILKNKYYRKSARSKQLEL